VPHWIDNDTLLRTSGITTHFTNPHHTLRILEWH
jgi:hypothetical protein